MRALPTVGRGPVLYPDLLPAPPGSRSTSTPAGWAGSPLRRLAAGEPMPVEPLYLRRPDALTTAERGAVVSALTPTLREAHWTDMPALAALESDLFADDAWSEPTWWAELAGRPAPRLRGARPTPTASLGYAGLDHGGDVADIMTIAVAPRAQGRGLGRLLLDELERRAPPPRRGARHARGARRQRRRRRPLRARRLRRAEHRRRYYQPGDVDALVLRKSLHERGPAMADEPLVLGIETSCDETGVGIVRGETLLVDAIASSVDEHARFGGVVPEVASRAHLEAMVPTIERACATAGVALRDLDAIAVTSGPGLAGALMVGVAAAKALSLALGMPLYGVNHLAGHVAVDIVEHGPLPEPTLALLVSGGHSSLLLVPDVTQDVRSLGSTIDDAAGEAFDKVARVLGLPFPGGPHIDRAAREGPVTIDFPRGLTRGATWSGTASTSPSPA